MTITMDSAGRVVLPKAIRDRARLKPGTPLDVRVVDGRIELEPACAEVRIEKKGGGWVARYVNDVPPLTQEVIDGVLDDTRMRSVVDDEK